MPNPTQANLHVDRLLTEFGLGYYLKDDMFIADQIAPTVTVQKSSDLYPVWSKEDLLRLHTEVTSRESAAPEAELRLSNTAYNCKYWPLKKLILEMDRVDADVDLDQAVTKFLIQQIKLRKEKEVISAAFTAANWDTTKQGAASGQDFVWFSDSSSEPFEVIASYRDTLREQCGFDPNVMIAGPKAHRHLRNHADVLDRFKANNAGVKGNVSNEWLAGAFDFEKYLVPKAVYNSAAETATFSGASMAGDFILMAYVDESNDKYTPTAMKNFSWAPFDGGSGSPIIERIEEKDPRGEWIKGSAMFDPKVTASDAGLLMINAAAA